MSAVINSDTEKGLQVLQEIITRVESHQYADKEQFGIRLALEEAIVNAIKHGNGYDLGKEVRIDYEVNEEFIKVRIEDQGAGFDPEIVPDPTAPENLERPCGRGLMLMRYYMRVSFIGAGNCVELFRQRGQDPPRD